MRKSPCKWISWDEEGRPSCEHGPAVRASNHWGCREKNRAYEKSRPRREYRANWARNKYSTDADFREMTLRRAKERWKTLSSSEEFMQKKRERERARYANDSAYRLAQTQNDTLWKARKSLERSIERADLQY